MLAFTVPAFDRRLIYYRLLRRWCGHKVINYYEAPFVKIFYLTDLAQKLLSRRIFSYLCAHLDISAQRQLSLRAFSYLCAEIVISARI